MQNRSKSSYAMGIIEKFISSVWQFICFNLAAFDPLRRRQVRVAAKRLIPTKAWASDDATSDEIARVALLRVLFLQRETRRAARHAEREAAVMLARASIEATISGLFLCHVPEAEKLFSGEIAKRAKSLLVDFANKSDMAGMLDEVFAQIGSGKLPTVADMVKQIKANGGDTEIGSLYTNFYSQISTLYVHSGSLGLLRHVHPKTQHTRERPYQAWSTRSAIHTVDGMVGLLAATIAGKDHTDFVLFNEYKMTHLRIRWTPLTFIVWGVLVTHIDLRQVPAMGRLVWHLRSKAKTGEPFTEADFDECIAILKRSSRGEPDDQAIAPIINALRVKLLPSRHDDENSTGSSR